MHHIIGRGSMNARAAERPCAAQFLGQGHPIHENNFELDNRLRPTGSLIPRRSDSGKQ